MEPPEGRRRPFVIAVAAGLAVLNLAMASVRAWEWLVPLHALLVPEHGPRRCPLRGQSAASPSSGAHQVTSLALMGDIIEGHRRGRLVSSYRMSGSLAFSVAIVLSGWLSETVGLRGSFLLAACVYALAFLASLRITEPPRVAPVTAPAGFAALLRGPMRPLLIVGFTFGLTACPTIADPPHLPSAAPKRHADRGGTFRSAWRAPFSRKGLFRRMFTDVAQHPAEVHDALPVQLQFRDRGASGRRQP